MGQKLPRILIVTLFIIAASSLSFSYYLEWFQLEFLQNHPITVNLISGVVGFSTASLVVSVGFNYFVDREKISQGYLEVLAALVKLGRDEREICELLPSTFYDEPIAESGQARFGNTFGHYARELKGVIDRGSSNSEGAVPLLENHVHPLQAFADRAERYVDIVAPDVLNLLSSEGNDLYRRAQSRAESEAHALRSTLTDQSTRLKDVLEISRRLLYHLDEIAYFVINDPRVARVLRQNREFVWRNVYEFEQGFGDI